MSTTREIKTSQDLVFTSVSGAVKVGSNAVLHAGDIGSSVQSFSSKLADISGLTPNNNDVVKWNGSNFVASSELDPVYSTDNSTLQTVSNVYSVKDAGIGATQLASNAITSVKIADSAVTGAKLNSNVVGSGLSYASSQLTYDNSVLADLSGSQAMSNKTFSSCTHRSVAVQGSGQSSFSQLLPYELQTTDNASNALATIACDDNAITWFNCDITCASDGTDFSAWRVFFAISRSATGNCVLVGSPQIEILNAISGYSVSCSVSSTNALISVQDSNGGNNRWSCLAHSHVNPKYSA